MKYYAVTEDPNELLHYGVKGMKWGKHLFGDDLKPKSTAYKNAAKKLKSLASSVTKAVSNTKSAIQKSSAQRSINKQKKQEEKFNEAVAKTQRRIDTISNLNNLNKLTSYEKSVEQQYKADQKQAKANLKAEKAAIKREKKYAKNERKMERFMQEAREGRLKYGQLSDEQVQRVTDRLALERSARNLGSTEKPKFRKRMKEALQEGLLQGVTQGTAAGMREIAIAKVQNRLANKRVLDKKAEQQAERDRETARIKNKKTHKEMREDIKDEAYEAQVREGVSTWNRNGWLSTAGAAKELKRIKDLNDQRNWESEQERRTLDSQRQDRLNAAREAEELESRARMAYEYGYLPSSNKGNGGKQGKNQGSDKQSGDVEQLSNYYRLRYLDGETLQQRAAREEKERQQKQKEINDMVRDWRMQEQKEKKKQERKQNRQDKMLNVYARGVNNVHAIKTNASKYLENQHAKAEEKRLRNTPDYRKTAYGTVVDASVLFENPRGKKKYSNLKD